MPISILIERDIEQTNKQRNQFNNDHAYNLTWSHNIAVAARRPALCHIIVLWLSICLFLKKTAISAFHYLITSYLWWFPNKIVHSESRIENTSKIGATENTRTENSAPNCKVENATKCVKVWCKNKSSLAILVCMHWYWVKRNRVTF